MKLFVAFSKRTLILALFASEGSISGVVKGKKPNAQVEKRNCLKLLRKNSKRGSGRGGFGWVKILAKSALWFFLGLKRAFSFAA